MMKYISNANIWHLYKDSKNTIATIVVQTPELPMEGQVMSVVRRRRMLSSEFLLKPQCMNSVILEFSV